MAVDKERLEMLGKLQKMLDEYEGGVEPDNEAELKQLAEDAKRGEKAEKA